MVQNRFRLMPQIIWRGGGSMKWQNLCPLGHGFWLEDSWKYSQYTKCTAAAATAAKSLQSCPTLCDLIDGSPPGSPVPGILQARTLEWVAISFSNAWKRKVKVKPLSPVQLLATPCTAAYQAPPSMGFSRQEYWSGVPLSLSFQILFFHSFSSVLTSWRWLQIFKSLKSLSTLQASHSI